MEKDETKIILSKFLIVYSYSPLYKTFLQFVKDVPTITRQTKFDSSLFASEAMLGRQDTSLLARDLSEAKQAILCDTPEINQTKTKDNEWNEHDDWILVEE